MTKIECLPHFVASGFQNNSFKFLITNSILNIASFMLENTCTGACRFFLNFIL